jgi:hypothetical protein
MIDLHYRPSDDTLPKAYTLDTIGRGSENAGVRVSFCESVIGLEFVMWGEDISIVQAP